MRHHAQHPKLHTEAGRRKPANDSHGAYQWPLAAGLLFPGSSDSSGRSAPEKFSGHLNKGKKNIQPPPYPPQGEAADAEEERENESKIETHVEQSAHQGTASRSSCSGASQRAGLQIARPASTDVNACRFRGELKPLSQDTAPFKAEERGLTANRDIWQAACTHLQQKLSENDFELWIKPIQATETEAGLRLDCQDRFHLAGVQERFGTDIRDAMQLTENTKFYFSFGEKEREIQEENERKEQIRAAQLVLQQRQALQKMSVEEQFTVLFDNYPPHRRSSSDKQPAFMFFQKALKRGETSIFDLLTALKRQKVSDLWQKDQGRWIPGIGKWLGERRWADTL